MSAAVRRVALVTGSARGIGRGIALRLAADGYRVAVNGPSADDGPQETVAQIAAAGGEAHGFVADVGVAVEATGLVDAVVAHFGRLDAVVCNAGICPFGPFDDVSEAVWDRTHQVNLKGTFLVSQAASRVLIAQGDGGRIVAISSISAIAGGSMQTAYTPTKAGQVSLMRSLAIALGPYGITCNCVEPGTIETDLNAEVLSDPRMREHYESRIPVRRIGAPADIAGAVAFLVSEDAAYVNGTEILVDGGALVNLA
ncbi:SDR family NAD(P)-dependent oxidoreductase [Conexibacter sp. CPCC 206217]|uniref:SDR family NAD(P)-dependent oxidoreductase n=1 Tax=Conexibacter sp. CPCC 206217 TaxID=3064574 RepID=UPI0027200721|nr:SDR family NAD(P)-dependent oxidoreductase [Conexibacter sp. CPCC 206217]MDO8210044.1 SDR family NAD(P)-dependent oxidoreductase [Conexibacter sp. CPCC 206217]